MLLIKGMKKKPQDAGSRGLKNWQIAELREMTQAVRELLDGVSDTLNSVADKGLEVVNCEPLGLSRAAKEVAKAAKSINNAWIDIKTGRKRRVR